MQGFRLDGWMDGWIVDPSWIVGQNKLNCKDGGDGCWRPLLGSEIGRKASKQKMGNKEMTYLPVL